MKSKKIMSAILIPPLLFGVPCSLSASSFWDDRVFTNFTPPMAAKDPNSGVTYYSGGSYNIKFKAATEFTPMFGAQGPDIKLGCGGVSFNLGFGSLIDFEQLSQQLSQAGQSFAWGLLIGLVYSLPALKQIFDTINEWSAKIQDMLANACNAGKAISSDTKVAKEINKNIEDFATIIDSGLKNSYISKQLNKGDQALTSLISGGKSTKEDNKKLVRDVLDTFIKKSAGGVVSSYLTNLISSGQETGISFKYPMQKPGYSIERVALEDVGLSKGAVLTTYLILTMIPDVKMSLTEYKFFTDAVTNLNGLDLKKLEKSIVKLQNASLFNGESTVYQSLLTTDKDEDISSFFINGGNSTLKKSIVKNFQPSIIKVSKKYKNGRVDKFLILGSKSLKHPSSSSMKWEGLKKESATMIARIVNNTIAQMNNGQLDKSAISMPLLMPEKYNLLKDVIVVLKIKDGKAVVSPTGNISFPNKQIEALMNSIAEENTYVATNLLFTSLVKNISTPGQSTEEKKGSNTTPAQNDLSAALSKQKQKLFNQLTLLKKSLQEKRVEAQKDMVSIMQSMKLKKEMKNMIGERK